LTLATDTAQASGLAMKVGPCISAPASPALIVCAMSVVHSVAARVRYPPVNALPTHMMSGLTPAWSAAKSSPVRPKPVAISSKISSTSCRRHSSRRSRR
jgi:hypothetical protein